MGLPEFLQNVGNSAQAQVASGLKPSLPGPRVPGSGLRINNMSLCLQEMKGQKMAQRVKATVVDPKDTNLI